MKRTKTLKNPKKMADVKIGNTKYPLLLADKIYENGSILKKVFGSKDKVLGQICRNRSGVGNFIAIDKNAHDKQHVFYHEVTHGVLYELSKIKRYRFTALKLLSEDEHFVDSLAKVLRKTFRMRDMKWKKGVTSI